MIRLASDITTFTITEDLGGLDCGYMINDLFYDYRLMINVTIV